MRQEFPRGFRNSVFLCSSQTIPKEIEENDQWQPKTSLIKRNLTHM